MKLNGEIKIEKRIPLPDIAYETRNPFVLAMRKMKNGDSFLCPITQRPYLSQAARKAGIVITTRTVDPANIRVWRIKSAQRSSSPYCTEENVHERESHQERTARID